MDQGAVIKVKITSTGKSARRRSISPAPRRSSRQFQRAGAGRARRGALCLPRDGRDDIPMNAGCLRPIRIIIPEGSMLNAAAISGRRRRRQCRDQPGGHRHAVRRARRAGGSAQGTMNNLTFGNARYQYYETICSGAPAGPGFDGAERRAHPHDQFAPDRSGSAGIALSRGAGGFPHPREAFTVVTPTGGGFGARK
jgi:5-oxoprolinase (ATP-hydrolysing)